MLHAVLPPCIRLASMAVRLTSPAGLQGGPQKLVVSLTDVVSCSSTDPTMGQAMVYLTKVRSHIRAPSLSLLAVMTSSTFHRVCHSLLRIRWCCHMAASAAAACSQI